MARSMKKRARLTKRRRKSRRSKTRRRRGGWGYEDRAQQALSPEAVSQYNRNRLGSLQNREYRPSKTELANLERKRVKGMIDGLNNEEGYDGMQIARPRGKNPTLAFVGGKKKKRKRKRKKRKTKKR